MHYFYGKINRGQVSRPLYRGCSPLNRSVIRGFTVDTVTTSRNDEIVVCDLWFKFGLAQYQAFQKFPNSSYLCNKTSTCQQNSAPYIQPQVANTCWFY